MCTTPVLVYRCKHRVLTKKVVRCDLAYYGEKPQCAKPKKKEKSENSNCAKCNIKREGAPVKASTEETLDRCRALGATEEQIRSTKATPEQMEETVWNGQSWSFRERTPSPIRRTGWDVERDCLYMEVTPYTRSTKLGPTTGSSGRTIATPGLIRMAQCQQKNYYQEDERSRYESSRATKAGSSKTKATPKPMQELVLPDYQYREYDEDRGRYEERGRSRLR